MLNFLQISNFMQIRRRLLRLKHSSKLKLKLDTQYHKINCVPFRGGINSTTNKYSNI